MNENNGKKKRELKKKAKKILKCAAALGGVALVGAYFVFKNYNKDKSSTKEVTDDEFRKAFEDFVEREKDCSYEDISVCFKESTAKTLNDIGEYGEYLYKLDPEKHSMNDKVVGIYALLKSEKDIKD